MNTLKTLTMTTLALALTGTLALAETFTKGIVKKVDAAAGKVTILHEELVNLDMPAMTMVFRADADVIAQMAEGEEIEFTADRVEGKLKVMALR